ncbi:MAG TPA: CDP-diacylglycerol--serine O-phosphatidyltransferase [Tepidisphaeraceae bacterium]|jgi:CDP-diacylglycerol--serine O-phosphatidyltransferase
MSLAPDPAYESREHRRRRFRRHRRRAYIRSVYFLPSAATLGNAICGFGAMYVASLKPEHFSRDPLTNWFSHYNFVVAAYLIFAAMLFDALDGRLARFTRHTTDFGGQLDSLADVLSFGAAPAFLALEVFKSFYPEAPPAISRLIWAIGALYMSCAAMRLARFNVSNEHGEQHHFSFLGLPSPGAGAAVAAFILMQQHLFNEGAANRLFASLSTLCIWLLPAVVLSTGLLMVSDIRYPHIVNRYLRGRRSLGRLLAFVIGALLLVVAHQITLALGSLLYAFSGLGWFLYRMLRKKPPTPS